MIHLQIQELLNKNGKTKYWLTNKMGKSHQSVSNLMKKDLSGIHFEQLCNIFNCEIGEIIVLKKEKENKKNEQTNKQTK